MKMKNVAIIAALATALAGGFGLAGAIDGKHANGYVVSEYFQQGVCTPYAGHIFLITIQNGAPVRTDTIYHWTQGMGQYPCFDIEGRRIAFYRWGTAASANGATCTQINNGVSYVSVMNRDGSNVKNLVALRAAPWSEISLAWPAGDWIFYLNPKPAVNDWDRPTTQIRKVNVVTLEDQFVWEASDPASQMRRFTLSADGTRMGEQIIYGAFNNNGVYQFPPSGGSLTKLVGMAGCNGAVSASGRYAGSYFAGAHVDCFLTRVDQDYTTFFGLFRSSSGMSGKFGDMASWAGKDLFPSTAGCELIRFAVNSDKWVLQGVGWCGHAGAIVNGGNSGAANWVDHTAFIATNNPPVDCANPSGKANNTGSIWIDGGPENLGKWEDTAGVWHSVPGYIPSIGLSVDTVKFAADQGGANPAPQSVNVAFSSGTTPVALSAISDAAWLSVLVEGSGGSQSVRASAAVAGLSSGNYSGKVTVGAGTLMTAFFVALRVNGTATPSSIQLTSDTVYAQTQGTAQFVAALKDQFGQAIAGTITWSADGGTITPSGLFTSSGGIGTFRITAQSGSLSKQGAVVVTANKPLSPDGYLKELLCLETSAGSPYLPSADATGIEAAYTGAGGKIPADGQQVTIGANAYTWKLRTDADGVWANDGSKDDFVAYWYTTLISQSSRTGQIVCYEDDLLTAWIDGVQLYQNGVMQGGVEAWGAHFNLRAGGTGMLLKLTEESGGNYMSVRIADPQTNQGIRGVQYAPPGDISVVGTWPPRATPGLESVMIMGNRIRIREAAGSPWGVSIISTNGAIVKSYSGRAERQNVVVGIPKLAPGVYVIRIATKSKSVVARILAK
jgi:hypothetical protein